MKSFNVWAIKRLSDGKRCSLEPAMHCIPLAGDPICRACYETEREAEDDENNSRRP